MQMMKQGRKFYQYLLKLQIKRKKKKIDSAWIKERENFYVDRGDDTEINESVSGIKSEFQGKAPVEAFEALFDEDIRGHIVQQSVIYASQNNRHDIFFFR